MMDVKSFLAGFFSTLVFHQGLLGLFYKLGLFPHAPFNMAPTHPLGVPSVISLAFFGGLWGILIWRIVAKKPRAKQILLAIVLGAIGPTAVAIAVVFPLKGIAVKLAMIPFGLILNGVWGLGVWILMWIMRETRSAPVHEGRLGRV